MKFSLTIELTRSKPPTPGPPSKESNHSGIFGYAPAAVPSRTRLKERP